MIWLIACTPPHPPPTPPPPIAPTPDNVLIVLLDDTRDEDVGTYGAPDAAPTPVLDGLAAEGVRFTNAWAAPVCSSARASMLTGRYPSRLGVGGPMEWGTSGRLRPREITLPEMLEHSALPWDSSQVGKWHVHDYSDKETNPGDQGFAWYAGTPGNLWGREGKDDYTDWEKNDNGALARTTAYAMTDANDDAIARVQQMQEPWLLYYGMYAPHAPYHVPPQDLVKGDFPTPTDQFRAMITAAGHPARAAPRRHGPRRQATHHRHRHGRQRTAA